MPTLSCTIKYDKNTGMVLSPAELASIYLYGVKIQDKSGTALSKETYEFYIKAAQQEIEKYLNIKLLPTVIEENFDFYRDEFRRWGMIQVTYPCVKPYELYGYLGTIKQIGFPKEWITGRRTSDGYTYFRRVFIVPTQSADPLAVRGETLLYSGVIPYTNMMGFGTIPSYWAVKYLTGLHDLHYDLVDIVGSLASIPILAIAGDIPFGVPGLSSQSLSLDNVSSSISTTASAMYSLYSARIKELKDKIKTSLDRLRAIYKGIVCSSM